MKQRYNISIEYAVMEDAKEYIKNISAYLEKCLKRANRFHELTHKKQMTEQEAKELNKLCEIADYSLW